jgi:hypothetical protein
MLHTVESLAMALRTDYAQMFLTAYPNTEAVRDLKNRLWARLKAFHPQDVVDGFERACQSANGFMPNIQQIAAAADEAAREHRRRMREDAEAARVTALPPPTRTVDVAEELARAKRGVSIPLSVSDPAEFDRRVAEHRRLVATARGAPRLGENALKPCAAGGCSRRGTVSGSTNGTERWYCLEHVHAR